MVDSAAPKVADLLAIYRAIDEAVEADASGRTRRLAARYIRQYEDDAVVGWVRALDGLLAPDGRNTDDLRAAPVGPTLEQALVNVARSEPAGRVASRLLVAFAVLGRLPGADGPDDGGALFTRAVGAQQPRDADLEVGALVPVLLDDDLFPDLDAWPQFTATATSMQLLSKDMAGQIPPCSDTIAFEEVEGDPQPATKLSTNVSSDDITDEQVQLFKDPMQWPPCNSLYCDMLDGGVQPDGRHLYTEVLSPDCSDGSIERIVVGLLFEVEDRPNGFKLTYDLAPPPDSGNGRVVVDHGMIIAQKKGTTWTFRTTKTLRFAGVLDGTPLAMMACILGYGTYAADFLNTFAGQAQPAPVDPPIPDWDDSYEPTDPEPDPGPDQDVDPGWDADPEPDPT